MSQFFISCKESRIESNRSFYGCFSLGPFEPSQSITIANTLRRTLLSELYGLAIVSVEIEGASHEYSSLPGVRESILDILLNLKEIVLKKTIKNFKPQIGYLRARGPGVVNASHLRLPPFIQCVDPSQYIANLSDNGFLNMKFTIQYGNKWVSPLNSNFKQDLLETDLAKLETSNSDFSSLQRTPPLLKKGREAFPIPPFGLRSKKGSSKRSKKAAEKSEAFFCREMGEEGKNELEVSEVLVTKKPFLLLESHLKKRRLILKKLKQIGLASSNSYIKMFFSPFLNLKKVGEAFPFNPSPPFGCKARNAVASQEQERSKKVFLSSYTTPVPPSVGCRKTKVFLQPFCGAKRPSVAKQLGKGVGLGIQPTAAKEILQSEAFFCRGIKRKAKKKKASLMQENKPISLNSATFLDNYRKKRNISRKNRFLMDFNSNLKKRKTQSLDSSPFFKIRIRRGLLLGLGTQPNPSVAEQEKKGIPPAEKRAVGLRGAKQKGLSRSERKKQSFFLPGGGLRSKKGDGRKLKNQVSFMNSGLTKKENIFLNSNPLTIDAVFNPINKINYIIELNDFKISSSKLQTSFESSELHEILRNIKKPNTLFFEATNLNRLTFNKVEKTLKNSFFKVSEENKKSELPEELETVLKIKNELSPFSLKRETTKHNIILEIWTNGSIHPRDALYQGFKNLIKLFAKLKKINTFGVNIFSLKKDPELLYFANKESGCLLRKEEKKTPHPTQPSAANEKSEAFFFPHSPSPPVGVASQGRRGERGEKGWAEQRKKKLEDSQPQRSSFSQPILKKIKMDEIRPTLLQNLLPLDETSFLSTYVAPKLKNYYLKADSYSILGH